MSDQSILPFGSWPSPITAAVAAKAGLRFGPLRIEGNTLYWLEHRPAEGGRGVIMGWRDGDITEVTPPTVNVRGRVHEYGGGDFWVRGNAVFFCNDTDQRLYRIEPGGTPEPITPPPPCHHGWRYADGVCTPDGRWLVCVREAHAGHAAVVNELVAVPADGSGPPRVVSSGKDFYAFPRISPNGDRIAWTCWDAPDMPWDRTELWVGRWDSEGALGEPRCLASSPEESVFQPAWSPDNVLHYVSDRDGWWNLYRIQDGVSQAIHPAAADFGVAQWNLGLSTYAFLPGKRIACLMFENGWQRMKFIDSASGAVTDATLPWTAYTPAQLHALEGRVAFVAGGPGEAPAVRIYDPVSGGQTVVRRSVEEAIEPAWAAEPEALEFAGEGEGRGYAWYYAPRNPRVRAPRGSLPPLLVNCHGGPTANAACQMSLSTLFWTSRGFAVVDVNYRGSSGFGRAYRQALYGRWGIADRQDCAAAARALLERNVVDPRRLAIRGASAGGYTALCAAAFERLFAAATSYYGVADLETLRQQTHKFEAGYLEGLVGPYPQTRDRYSDRSPVHFAHLFACPVLLLQGVEDPVVPAAQAEAMLAGLQANGNPCAYVAFPGEQHGFRRAETVQRALETELAFYARIMDLAPPDPLPNLVLDPP